MLAAILFCAHGVVVDVPDQMRVLAANAKLGAAVIDYQSTGKRHVVLVRGTSEEIDQHDDVCGEGAQAKSASRALQVELKKRDVDLVVYCSALPAVTKVSDSGALRVSAGFDGVQPTLRVQIDNVPVFIEEVAGQAPVTTFLVHSSGGLAGRMIVDWRDADRQFHVAGVLPNKENNGVNVAALLAVDAKAPCSVSVASNPSIANTVAVTVAYALKTNIPITQAKTTREKSVVYASDACSDVAKQIAAKVPGGADVDKLTWKATSDAGIVVALGETATPK